MMALCKENTPWARDTRYDKEMVMRHCPVELCYCGLLEYFDLGLLDLEMQIAMVPLHQVLTLVICPNTPKLPRTSRRSPAAAKNAMHGPALTIEGRIPARRCTAHISTSFVLRWRILVAY